MSLIDKEASNFMWGVKRPLMRSEIFNLPRIEGGLGIKKAEHVMKAKRIKFIVHVLKSRNATWATIPEQNFKCLDTAMHIDHYALRVDKSTKYKITSFFYKDCIESMQELNRKG